MILCRICKILLTKENWYSSRKLKGERICKSCYCKNYSKWYHKDIEKNRERKRGYYYKNPEACKKATNKHYAKISEEIFRLLGNKCSNPNCLIPNRCSDSRCLQIDHVKNNGNLEREKYGFSAKYRRKILEEIKHGSKDYQLLCANCNAIKESERKKMQKLSLVCDQ